MSVFESTFGREKKRVKKEGIQEKLRWANITVGGGELIAFSVRWSVIYLQGRAVVNAIGHEMVRSGT